MQNPSIMCLGWCRRCRGSCCNGHLGGRDSAKIVRNVINRARIKQNARQEASQVEQKDTEIELDTDVDLEGSRSMSAAFLVAQRAIQQKATPLTCDPRDT
jgi:hypothetical protein